MELILDGVLEAFRLLLTGDPEVWRTTMLSLQISATATFLTAPPTSTTVPTAS